MSESGKPTQNVPVESFFGHLKDEVNYKKFNNFEELKDKIDKYVYYYNTSRYQWNKNMLAPIELRDNLISYNYCPVLGVHFKKPQPTSLLLDKMLRNINANFP